MRVSEEAWEDLIAYTEEGKVVPVVGPETVTVATEPGEGGLSRRQNSAAGGQDGTVRLWDTARREPVGAPLRGHPSRVSDVAFSPVPGLAARITARVFGSQPAAILRQTAASTIWDSAVCAMQASSLICFFLAGMGA